MAAKKSKPAKKTNKTKDSMFSRLFRLMSLAAIWGIIFAFFIGTYYYITLPDIDDIKTIEQNAGVEIYDRNDIRIARFGQARGETVVVDKMPTHLKEAVISIEDRRFYKHPGVDILGISRAMVTNVAKGGFVQGGSTLTQQLAKNLFLEPDKTISRKIQEAMLALWLEAKLTKDEILTAYLNRVYFGSGAYGITAAANHYFSKKPEQLTLPESAMLAASLRAPSRTNPKADPKASAERAALVLDAMLEEGYIDDSELQAGKKALENRKARSLELSEDALPHYYTDWVLDQIGNYTTRVPDGMNIYTAHDPKLYEIAQKHIQDLFETRATGKNIGQVAAVLMEYDGTVRMLIGGKSYAASQYNRAVQAMRQPGSSFKPVVYLAALQRGHSPSTLVWDSPFESGKYRPQNFGNKYYGEVPISEALMRSLNTAAVRLAEDAGMANVIETARNLGITSDIKPELASALGASETRLIEMTAAYAVIANGGRAVYPKTILRIKDKGGRLVYQRGADAMGPRVFSSSLMRDMKYMMRGVVQNGTGRAAYLTDVADQGGKTGTSQNYKDALFIGYANGYVLGVWMGNDNNRPMKSVTGGSEPARLWHAIMRDTLQTRPVNYRDMTSQGWGSIGLFDRMIHSWGGDSRTAGGNRNYGGDDVKTETREIFGEEVEVQSAPAGDVNYND